MDIPLVRGELDSGEVADELVDDVPAGEEAESEGLGFVGRGTPKKRSEAPPYPARTILLSLLNVDLSSAFDMRGDIGECGLGMLRLAALPGVLCGDKKMDCARTGASPISAERICPELSGKMISLVTRILEPLQRKESALASNSKRKVSADAPSPRVRLRLSARITCKSIQPAPCGMETRRTVEPSWSQSSWVDP